MSEALSEIALTEPEITEILTICGGRALLVGGQALAFWAQYYKVARIGVLQANVTYDADFIGSQAIARELASALRPSGWRFWPVSMDDATPQTAKLDKRVEGQGIKQIDFLSSIIGLETARIERRAVKTQLADGTPLRVLHPLDVLESRLQNLVHLPSKRNPQGIAQARLALDIIRRYLEESLEAQPTDRTLEAIERIIAIAQTKKLIRVLAEHDLDLLRVVPADRIPSKTFREKRWPQVLAHQKTLFAAEAKRRERGKR